MVYSIKCRWLTEFSNMYAICIAQKILISTIFLCVGSILYLVLVLYYTFPLSTIGITYVVDSSYWMPNAQLHWIPVMHCRHTVGKIEVRHAVKFYGKSWWISLIQFHGWPSTQPGTCTQPCPIVHTAVAPLFTQPCPGRTMSTAVCIYVAGLCASCPAV